MIFEKRGMWKSTFGSQKFTSYEEAVKFEEDNGYMEKAPEPVKVEEPVKAPLSPLDRLRGITECETCGEYPCVCEQEWNLAEETL